MKKHILLLLIVPFIACKPSKKEAVKETIVDAVSIQKEYPEAMQKVFDAHGGIADWNAQRTLSFTIPKPDNAEVHTVDLLNRNEHIATPKYTLGFDGKPWVLNGEEEYKGNPEFYHNLMFYFYAMPFVVGDDGINYSDTDDLVFEGKNYPGIRISYNDGVGTSPKDEYFIHYDADTNQMAWLGYTVTYRSGERSDKISWIRYNDWANYNGLAIPNSISWYKVEEGTITELRNTVPFENVIVSKEAKPASFYQKPEAATYFTRPE